MEEGKGNGIEKDIGDREVKRLVKHPFQQNDRPERKRQTESTEECRGKVQKKITLTQHKILQCY